MPSIQVPYAVEGGLSIDGKYLLNGTGVPGSTTVTDTAVKGSLYTDDATGLAYAKDTAGSGTDKWSQFATLSELNAAILGIEWRSPVDVVETTLRADVAAAVTAANVADTVDGETILASSRVLLSNLTSGTENVYIVSGSTGNWTFTEEGNTPTNGDALLVKAGTSAGQQWRRNATEWVQNDTADASESGYIRDFVGKSAAGIETPTYGTNNVVTNGDTLETGVEKLDAEIGVAVATAQSRTTGSISDQAINLNIEALDDSIGGDVTTIKSRTAGPILAANSTNANVSALDEAIGNDVTTIQSRTAGPMLAANTVNANLSALDDAIGADVTPNARTNNPIVASNTVLANTEALDDAIGVTPTSTNIISASAAVNTNLSSLDAALHVASKSATKTSLTTIDTIDSELVDDYQRIEWVITAQSVGTPANVYSCKLAAIHDGSTSDAGNVDYSIFGALTTGTKPTGLTFTVDLDGSTTTQTMRLRAVSTDAVNITAYRAAM